MMYSDELERCGLIRKRKAGGGSSVTYYYGDELCYSVGTWWILS